MKRTVPFEIFGASQYLMIDILRLGELNRAIGRPIYETMATGNVGEDFVLKALPIAMKQHYHNATPEFFAEKIAEHLENGGKFDDIAIPIVRAVLVSGILGKAVSDRVMGIITGNSENEVPEEPKNEEPTAAKPSKRSKNG